MSQQHHDIVAEVESRRFQLNINLLKIYNYYRVFMGATLLAVFVQGLAYTRLGILQPTTFLYCSLGYILLNLASAVAIQALPDKLFQRQFIFLVMPLIDILALTYLMYLSGGVGSGLGIFTLVSVAAGNIILTGSVGTLLAAVATIAGLYEEFYLSIAVAHAQSDFFQIGVLGILYFATSLAIQYLSRRLRHGDILSLTQAAEVADLERINRSIIQRMRTGIIVVGENNHIRSMNQSAKSLLGSASGSNASLQLPTSLLTRLNDWRLNSSLRTRPFQVSATTPEIRVNFSPVRPDRAQADTIIYLEDTIEIQQQAQQLKLAALGRLSAGIAHEIRNPLGAISHAAQLLGESSNLDKGDIRLTDIIHNHCQRMNGVIENVLELSRRSTPSPVRIQLQSWLQEFVRQFKEAAMQDVEIDYQVIPENTEVRMDPSQLTQAVTNLAQNGIRYSHAKTGRSTLHLVGGVDESTERPFLKVIDEGSGVDEEWQARLFEPFFTTERNGTGLGLYLSRELCEANRASLNYSRAEYGGSCFRITFAHPDRITTLGQQA